jgi:hypothetical protein
MFREFLKSHLKTYKIILKSNILAKEGTKQATTLLKFIYIFYVTSNYPFSNFIGK